MAAEPPKPTRTAPVDPDLENEGGAETGDALADYRGPIVLIVGILVIVGAGLYFRSYQEGQRAAGAWAEIDEIETHGGSADEVVAAYEKLYSEYGTTGIGPAIQLRLGAYCMKVGKVDRAEKAYQVVAAAPENTVYPLQGQAGLNAVKRARAWTSSDTAKMIVEAQQRAAEKKKKEEEDHKKAEEERKKADEERKKAEEAKKNAPPPVPPPEAPPGGAAPPSPPAPPGGAATPPPVSPPASTTPTTSSTSSTSTSGTAPEPAPPPK